MNTERKKIPKTVSNGKRAGQTEEQIQEKGMLEEAEKR